MTTRTKNLHMRVAGNSIAWAIAIVAGLLITYAHYSERKLIEERMTRMEDILISIPNEMSRSFGAAIDARDALADALEEFRSSLAGVHEDYKPWLTKIKSSLDKIEAYIETRGYDE